MKIVKPYAEIITPIDGESILKHVELCGRVCYKSEDRITPESAKQFVAGIIKRGHESVLEHYTSAMKAYFDLGEFQRSDAQYNWTLDELAKLPVQWYGGADLSKMHDLTAAALYGEYNGIDIVITHAWFPVVAAAQKADEDNIVTIGLVVAALGPVLIIGGKLISGLGTVIQLFAFLAANPIVAVIAIVGALVAAIVTLWNTNEDFRNAVISIWEKITSVFQAFDEFLKGVFEKDWTESFGAFGNVINAFFQSVSNIWEAIKQIFNGIIEFIKGVFTGNWEQAWNGVKDIFEGIFNLLIGIAKIPLNAIIGFINTVIGGLNNLIDKINEFLEMPGKALKFFGIDFDFNIPKIPSIPMLAKGGTLSSGSAIVGEAGPELLSLINGKARVTPLTGAQKSASVGGVHIEKVEINGYKASESRIMVRDLNRELGRAY